MEIINGIAYAGTAGTEKRVLAVKPWADGMLLVTFSPGEKRLYDVTPLLSYPAFSSRYKGRARRRTPECPPF